MGYSLLWAFLHGLGLALMMGRRLLCFGPSKEVLRRSTRGRGDKAQVFICRTLWDGPVHVGLVLSFGPS